MFKNRRGVHCIVYAIFCRKSPVHTYLELETGDALFTCEWINRQRQFLCSSKKRSLGVGAMCNAAMLNKTKAML